MRFLSVLILFSTALSSEYGPHYREGNPWFEGWYTRVSLPLRNSSAGFIVGHFPDQHVQQANYYAAILGQVQSAGLKEVHAYGDNLTFTGNSVFATDQGSAELPSFALSVSGKGKEFASIQVSGDTGKFSATIDGEMSIEIDIVGPAVHWGSNGEGPEGWVSRLPIIGLSWFVYSLASPAFVTLKDLKTSTLLLNKEPGFAHMEKNWGSSFPKGWIWAEGMHIQGSKPDVLLALAGGFANVAGIEVPNQYLIGYRSPILTWNFRPQDPAIFTVNQIDACQGVFSLTASSLGKKLQIDIKADPKSFSSVDGPTGTGFQKDSVESYTAQITISAFTGLTGQLAEKQVLNGAAIEFGGVFQCIQ